MEGTFIPAITIVDPIVDPSEHTSGPSLYLSNLRNLPSPQDIARELEREEEKEIEFIEIVPPTEETERKEEKHSSLQEISLQTSKEKLLLHQDDDRDEITGTKEKIRRSCRFCGHLRLADCFCELFHSN